MKFFYENGLTISGDVNFPIHSIVSGSDTSDTNLFFDLDIDDGSDTGGLTLNGDRREVWNTAPIPKGGIIFWDSTVDGIPTGWAVCSGGDDINGVVIPNLLDKFIVGTNTSYSSINDANIGTEGGSNDVTLTNLQVAAHTHAPVNSAVGGSHRHELTLPLTNDSDKSESTAIEDSKPLATPGFIGQSSANTTASHDHDGFTVGPSTASQASPTPHENRPPYYALVLIIRTEDA